MFTFDDLPAPGVRRLAVRVRPAAQRELRSGHPWLFDGGIDGDVVGVAGDLAVVFDAKRKFLAVGLGGQGRVAVDHDPVQVVAEQHVAGTGTPAQRLGSEAPRRSRTPSRPPRPR